MSKSQLDKAKEKLVALAPNVTKGDKQKCVSSQNIHLNTVNVYLRGEGVDLEIAVNLIKILQSEIKKREAVLA